MTWSISTYIDDCDYIKDNGSVITMEPLLNFKANGDIYEMFKHERQD